MAEPIVTSLPLASLTTPLGLANRHEDLGKSDIQNLLRCGPVRFVVADVGLPLRWLSEAECFVFWKASVQSNLAEPDARIFLDDFGGGYCYLASLWRDGGSPIVLLTKLH